MTYRPADTHLVVALLKRAGLQAAVRTRRQTRSGYTVRKMGPQAAVFWNDHAGVGDGADRFAEARDVLAAAGFVEVYTNPKGLCVRVLRTA